MGKFFINQLKDDLGNLKIVREIRGMGLMIGIELKKPNLPVVKDCLEKTKFIIKSNILKNSENAPSTDYKKGTVKNDFKKTKICAGII